MILNRVIIARNWRSLRVVCSSGENNLTALAGSNNNKSTSGLALLSSFATLGPPLPIGLQPAGVKATYFAPYESRGGGAAAAGGGGASNETSRISIEILKGLAASAGLMTVASIIRHEIDKKNSIDKFQQYNITFDELINKFNEMTSFSRFTNRQFDMSGDSQQTMNIFKSILCINVLIFGCWNLNIFHNILLKYFLVTPNSPFLANILCQYSHILPTHLFFNMYCLNSFMPSLSHLMRSEDFITLYTIGGIAASIASKTFKLLYGISSPSLGASGSIMTMLGIICSKNPNSSFTIPFIGPALGISFDGKTTLTMILCGEILMFLFGSTNIDHIAHIAGLVTGIVYSSDEGTRLYYNTKGKIIRLWETFRKF